MPIHTIPAPQATLVDQPGVVLVTPKNNETSTEAIARVQAAHPHRVIVSVPKLGASGVYRLMEGRQLFTSQLSQLPVPAPMIPNIPTIANIPAIKGTSTLPTITSHLALTSKAILTEGIDLSFRLCGLEADKKLRVDHVIGRKWWPTSTVSFIWKDSLRWDAIVPAYTEAFSDLKSDQLTTRVLAAIGNFGRITGSARDVDVGPQGVSAFTSLAASQASPFRLFIRLANMWLTAWAIERKASGARYPQPQPLPIRRLGGPTSVAAVIKEAAKGEQRILLGDDFEPEEVVTLAMAVRDSVPVAHTSMGVLSELWPPIPTTTVSTTHEGFDPNAVPQTLDRNLIWELANKLVRRLNAADLWIHALHAVAFFCFRPAGVAVLGRNALSWSLPPSELSPLAMLSAMAEERLSPAHEDFLLAADPHLVLHEGCIRAGLVSSCVPIVLTNLAGHAWVGDSVPPTRNAMIRSLLRPNPTSTPMMALISNLLDQLGTTGVVGEALGGLSISLNNVQPSDLLESKKYVRHAEMLPWLPVRIGDTAIEGFLHPPKLTKMIPPRTWQRVSTVFGTTVSDVIAGLSLLPSAEFGMVEVSSVGITGVTPIPRPAMCGGALDETILKAFTTHTGNVMEPVFRINELPDIYAIHTSGPWGARNLAWHIHVDIDSHTDLDTGSAIYNDLSPNTIPPFINANSRPLPTTADRSGPEPPPPQLDKASKIPFTPEVGYPDPATGGGEAVVPPDIEEALDLLETMDVAGASIIRDNVVNGNINILPALGVSQPTSGQIAIRTQLLDNLPGSLLGTLASGQHDIPRATRLISGLYQHVAATQPHSANVAAIEGIGKQIAAWGSLPASTLLGMHDPAAARIPDLDSRQQMVVEHKERLLELPPATADEKGKAVASGSTPTGSMPEAIQPSQTPPPTMALPSGNDTLSPIEAGTSGNALFAPGDSIPGFHIPSS